MAHSTSIPADNASLVAANKAGIFMRDTTVPGPHAAGPVAANLVDQVSLESHHLGVVKSGVNGSDQIETLSQN